MSTKKSSTERAESEGRDLDRENLAVLLAAAFAHPRLPGEIREHIEQGLCEIDGTFDKYENPAVMEEVLRQHSIRQRREARKGGAR